MKTTVCKTCQRKCIQRYAGRNSFCSKQCKNDFYNRKLRIDKFGTDADFRQLDRNCAHCHCLIKGRSRLAVFCSKLCWQKANRDAITSRVCCPICQSEFKRTNIIKTACSLKCRRLLDKFKQLKECYERGGRKVGPCRRCRRLFLGGSARRFCDACVKIAQKLYQYQHQVKSIATLDASYMRSLMRGAASKDFPPELVEMQRHNIILKRLTKERYTR